MVSTPRFEEPCFARIQCVYCVCFLVVDRSITARARWQSSVEALVFLVFYLKRRLPLVHILTNAHLSKKRLDV